MAHKNELPGWFPFALIASGLVALGAGIRSNWGRTPKPATQPQPVAQAGVLQDWATGDYRI